MASSKDFERIWESYQDVVKTQAISIVDYCQHNGIVYSQFQRWYKKHVSGVSVVPISDSDGLEAAEVMSQQKETPLAKSEHSHPVWNVGIHPFSHENDHGKALKNGAYPFKSAKIGPKIGTLPFS